MNPQTPKNKRTLWNRMWNPTEEDFISFRVFQMVSIPVSMVLALVFNMFLKNSKWIVFLSLGLLVVIVVLGLVPSIRFKIIEQSGSFSCRDREGRHPEESRKAGKQILDSRLLGNDKG